MTFRRSSIDNLNQKYTTTLTHNLPIGNPVITQSPGIHAIAQVPSVIAQPTHIANNGFRRSFVTGGQTFKRSFVGGNIDGQVIRRSTVGVQNPIAQGIIQGGFRRSAVQTIQNPPIVQVRQTPARVYESPRVEVTPHVITEKQVTNVSTPPPIIIPRKARGARGNYEDLYSKQGCCDSCCRACPWWVGGLFSLLLVLGILTGLFFAFKDKIGLFKSLTKENKQNTKTNQIKTTNRVNQRNNGNKNQDQNSKNTQTSITANQNQEDNKNKEQENKNPQEENKNTEQQNKNKEGQQKNNQQEQQNKNEQEQNKNITLPPPNDDEDIKNTEDKGENLELQSGALPNKTSGVNKSERSSITVTNITCQAGYFFHKSKCISCPEGSQWNGNSCIKKIKVPSNKPRKVTKTTTQTSSTSSTSPSNSGNQIKIKDAWSIIKPKQEDVATFQSKNQNVESSRHLEGYIDLM